MVTMVVEVTETTMVGLGTTTGMSSRQAGIEVQTLWFVDNGMAGLVTTGKIVGSSTVA